MLRCDAKDVDQTASQDGHSPRTVWYIHTIIRAALRDAVRWNKVGRNIADSENPPPTSASQAKRTSTWTGRRSAGSSSSCPNPGTYPHGCSTQRPDVAGAKRSACGGPMLTLRLALPSWGTRSSRVTTKSSSRTSRRRSERTSSDSIPAPPPCSSHGRQPRTLSDCWVVPATPITGWCSRWRMVGGSIGGWLC